MLKFSGDGKGDGAQVTIDVCRTAQGSSAMLIYASYVLTNVIISNFETGSDGDRPMEALNLNFTKLVAKITPMKADGSPGQQASVTYDLQTAKLA